MASTSYLPTVAVALACTLVVRLLLHTLTRLGSPLRKLPGPTPTLFTAWPLKLRVLTGQRMFWIHDLHQKYGPVVRISPNEIDVCTPSAVPKIHQGRGALLKSDWYADAFADFPDQKPGVFMIKDNATHSARRRLVSRGFSQSALRGVWETKTRDVVQYAIRRIKDQLDQNGVVDIHLWFSLLANDLGGLIMFGKNFNMLELGRHDEYTEVFANALIFWGICYELPIIKIIGPYLPFKLFRDAANVAPVARTYGELAVANARKGRDERSQLGQGEDSSVFAKMFAFAEKGEDLTNEDVASEAKNLAIGATDTTTMTLTFLVWSVAKNTPLRCRLEEEVAALSEEQILDVELEKLPLLNASIMEAVRLQGGISGSLMRDAPAGGIEIDGYFIPEGTIIDTQAYTLHRDKAVWGEDAEEFKPDRWINAKGECDLSLNKSVFLGFGQGVRGCLGVHMAKMNMRYTVAMLLRQCKGLRPADGFTDKDMVLLDYFALQYAGKTCLLSRA